MNEYVKVLTDTSIIVEELHDNPTPASHWIQEEKDSWQRNNQNAKQRQLITMSDKKFHQTFPYNITVMEY